MDEDRRRKDVLAIEPSEERREDSVESVVRGRSDMMVKEARGRGREFDVVETKSTTRTRERDEVEVSHVSENHTLRRREDDWMSVSLCENW